MFCFWHYCTSHKNVCQNLTSNTHLHAIIRTHFNIEFNLDVSVCNCMVSTETSKSNLTFGTLSDKCSWPKVNIKRLGTQEKVNKHRLHWRCLDDITTPPQFSASQVNSVSVCGTQVDTRTYLRRLHCPSLLSLLLLSLLLFVCVYLTGNFKV